MRIRIFEGRAWRQPLCGCLGLALMILPYAAIAQQSAVAQRKPPDSQAATARPAQQADDPEPAVDTSAQAHAASRSRAAVRGATAGSDAHSGGAHAGGARAHGKAMDHLQLGTTDITGNRELPKVMYIVPWKHSELGDLTGKPLNSLIDQTLQPVDRDVFRRENTYYRAVAAERAAGGGGQPARDER